MSYNLGTASGKIVVDGSAAAEGFLVARNSAEAFFGVIKAQMGSLDEFANKLLKIGAAGSVGLAGAITTAASLDKSMSAIQAVSGATSSQMETMYNKAMQLGADTAFTANEAASAMEELIKAGISVDDVMKGAADATVNLAAAGEIALPQAAEIAANALNNFGLKGEDMAHVADLIAGAANASAIGVGEFGVSMQQAGAVAAIAGVSIDGLSVAIAEMGNAGIKGSDAGTSLKTMLLNLQPTTERQIDKFKELGLITKDGANQFFDAQGKIKPMVEIQQILADATANQTEQQKLQNLEILFGQDAIRAAAIMAKNGADGYNKMAESMGKVTAADVAATRLDNLLGSLEQLKGSLESAAISIGKPFLGALKAITDAATFFVNVFNRLPEPVKSATGALFGLSTAAALVGGAFIKALPFLISFLTKALLLRQMRAVFSIFKAGYAAIASGQGILAGLTATWTRAKVVAGQTAGQVTFLAKSFAFLKRSSAGLKIGLGVVGVVLAAAAAGYAFLADQQEKSRQTTEDLTAAIEADSGAIGENTRAAVVNALQKDGVLESARKLGLGLDVVTDAALGNAEAIKVLNDAATAASRGVEAFNVAQGSGQGAANDNFSAIQKVRESVLGLNGNVNEASQAARDHASAMGTQVEGLGKTADAAEKAKTSISKLVEEIFRASEAAAGATRADLDFIESKIRLKKALDKSDGAIGKNSESARTSLRAFLDYRDSLKSVISAQLKLDPSGSKAAATMAKTRSSFISMAKAAGIPKSKIQELINLLGAVPSSVPVKFKSAGASVTKEEAKRVKSAIKEIPGLKEAKILAKGARPSRKDVKDFANSLEGIPKETKAAIVTAYSLGGVDAVKEALGSIPEVTRPTVKVNANTKGATDAKNAIASVKGKTVTVTIRTKKTGSNLEQALGIAGKRASGGPVKKGRAYLVGERGPEIFRANSDGEIYDAATSRAMLRAMSNVGANLRSGSSGISSDVLSTMSQVGRNMNAIVTKLDKESARSDNVVFVSGGDSKSGPVFKFDIHNPVAEKSSISTIKSVTRVGALGVFG